MATITWPARDNEEFERVMDYIATGGKYPELLGAHIDQGAVDQKLADLRQAAQSTAAA